MRLDQNQNGGGITVFIREDLQKINLLKPFSLNSILIKGNDLYVVLIVQTIMTSLNIWRHYGKVWIYFQHTMNHCNSRS